MPAAARATAALEPRLVRVAGRDTWHVYYPAERRRVSTGATSRAEAERVLADARADAKQSAAGSPTTTLAAVLDSYLANRLDRAKPGAERLAWAHKALTRHLGHRPPDTLTTDDCHAYARARAAEGVKPSTARTELQALRAAMRWHGAALKVELPAKPEPRSQWLTRDEADRLLEACGHRHLRLFVAVALHTGARRGAILGLTWDRVDLERRLIDFREPGAVASRKRRVPVPVNDTLAAILTAAKDQAASRFVVEWAGGSVDSVKHGIASAARRAGLPHVSPHVFRHTAATWMAQRGVPLWQVAGMLGHSDVSMVAAVYGHHHPDHLRDAAKALG